MRPPTPLPQELTGRVFTRTEASRLGVSSDRLRARDIQRIAHATYRHLGTAAAGSDVPLQDSAIQAGVPAQLEVLRALCRRSSVVRVSHVTAALLYGLPVPRRLTEVSQLHLTGRSSSHASASDPGVKVHRLASIPDCSYRLQGIPVTAPPELFVELARYLTVTELVVVGDQLVRAPRAGLDSRTRAWCNPQELAHSVSSGRGRCGITRARQALQLVRVGADSPPETRLRLALIAAGLPEPQLQIPLDPRDPLSPVGDAGYRRQRLVLQYEGEHHFTPEQQARDQRRNAQFQAAGWTVLLANRVDLRENFRSLIARVDTHLGASIGG